ncbi:ROK family protein [Aquibacillus halophilus]|uniref:ROK family protein n=1 Tax=Aquibacillus halophilus TaxID=930132 RepID=A0A6A8DE82_9BACI|nr:ROK family protein [Aquibacillus halophilus]MRH43864.1 ROK family protein [Aquibacillus halophilus]
MEKYIAFDVGGTKVKHAVVLENGVIITKGKYNTSCMDLDKFLKDMIDQIEDYHQQHNIRGIAISMPGFINVNTGYSETAGAIVVLNGKNLKSLLLERVSIPVEIENDGNCVALAEKLNGNAIDCESFICVTIGTGIGGGIIINNKVLHGHTFKGGEFGFMVTQNNSPKKEIWHNNGSTSGLIADYKELKEINTNEIIEGQQVFAEAEKDERVKKLIDEWLKNISNGIFNLVATLNPEKVLIGGGVSAQEIIIDGLKSHLVQNKNWRILEVPIEICKHKNDAGMIGALKHFLDRNSARVNV